MPGIFKNILPESKDGRMTRSVSRRLQEIKRVMSNVGNDSDTFEHFCRVSINDRITNLENNNSTYDFVNVQASEQFLSEHKIDERPSKISVMVKRRKSKRKSNKDRNKKIHSVYMGVKAIDDIDVVTCDDSLLQADVLRAEAGEDDVIFVNPPEDSVIIIDDSITVPTLDPPNIPCESEPRTYNTENQLPVHHSAINILDDVDEDKDIIFVKEETLSSQKRLKIKKKSKRKEKNRLTKSTLQVLREGNISDLFDQRCAKCINVNAELAKSCDCKRNNCGRPVLNTNPVAGYCQMPYNFVSGPQHSATISSNDPLSNIVNSVSRTGLREIVIDGSNVAFGHTNGRVFSVKGLQIAIDYFINRGHKVVAFVPQFRQKHNQTTNNVLLNSLADKGYVIFTPSREVAGRRITPYDDRYIIQYATACAGIVVSSDNYKDLFMERPDWRDTIANRLLMPTWVGDMLMFPEDPLGRNGPNLSRFLRFP